MDFKKILKIYCIWAVGVITGTIVYKVDITPINIALGFLSFIIAVILDRLMR